MAETGGVGVASERDDIGARVTADEDHTFFFMHLHKAGGTALWRAMKRQFSETEMYPGPGEAEVAGVTMSVDHLLERWPVRRSEVAVVAGHFPLCTRDLLGGRVTTFTVLRDPVDRVVSALRRTRQRSPGCQDMTLDEIYGHRLRKVMLRNHMVKMLSLTPDSMTKGMLTPVTFDRSHLERAREQLTTLDVVGFQEDLEAFRTRLVERFGWRLGPNEVVNTSDDVEVSEPLIDLIVEENALDIELYEFARKHCEQLPGGQGTTP